jgi:hypothetical protein
LINAAATKIPNHSGRDGGRIGGDSTRVPIDARVRLPRHCVNPAVSRLRAPPRRRRGALRGRRPDASPSR